MYCFGALVGAASKTKIEILQSSQYQLSIFAIQDKEEECETNGNSLSAYPATQFL